MTPTASMKTRNLYDEHPSVAMVQKSIAELKAKTGRSLDEWIRLIQKQGPGDEKARREWLKSKHKLGTNTTAWLAERASGNGGNFDDRETYLAAAAQFVEQQYSGPKSALRAIYDRLLSLGISLGADVKACPCKTMVPLYRNYVFAQIKPTTQTRIDLGFALGARPAEGRLIDTGGYAKKDRITHRIPISSLTDIDDEVKKWLHTAYEEDR